MKLKLSIGFVCLASIVVAQTQSSFPASYPVANDTVTGTTVNHLAKLTASGKAILATTSDISGIIGIVVAGAGITLTAQISQTGQIPCAFDGATTAGDYVQVSSTVAGDCHDAGASFPISGQTLGRVISTNGSAGLYAMVTFPGEETNGLAAAPGGSSNAIQFNSSGALGGITNSTSTKQYVSQTSGGAPGFAQVAAADISGLGTAATTNSSAYDIAGAAALNLAKAQNLSDVGNVSAARTNLGLGTAATTASGAYDVSGAAATVQSTSAQKSANLSDLANAPTARTNLGLGSAATQPSSAFDAIGVVNGTTVPTNSAADQALLTTAAATAVWSTIPACLDAGGNHLNYNTTTHLFSCGVTGGTAGSAAFNTLTGGSNSGMAAVCSTGCSINPALSGVVNANQISGSTPAASATTDTTNAANISSGTIPAGRLPSTITATIIGTASGNDASGAAATVQAASLQKTSNLSDVASAATSRTNLGLGTAATTAASAYDVTGAAAAAQAASDPSGSAAAVLATSAQKASNLSDVASATTSRTNLGLGTAAVQNAATFSLGGGMQSNTYTVGTGGVTANTIVGFDTSSPRLAIAGTGAFGGIAVSTVASGGTVEIVAAANALQACVFENTATAGHVAIPGTGIVTDCRDSGLSSTATVPSTTPIIGGIQTSASAGSTAIVRLHGLGMYGAQALIQTVGGISPVSGNIALATTNLSDASTIVKSVNNITPTLGNVVQASTNLSDSAALIRNNTSSLQSMAGRVSFASGTLTSQNNAQTAVDFNDLMLGVGDKCAEWYLWNDSTYLTTDYGAALNYIDSIDSLTVPSRARVCSQGAKKIYTPVVFDRPITFEMDSNSYLVPQSTLASAPVVLTGVTLTAGSKTATCTACTGSLVVGMSIGGVGVTSTTYVFSITDANTFVMSLPAVLGFVGQLTSGSAVIKGISSMNGIASGQGITSVNTGIPGATTISSINYGLGAANSDQELTASANATVTGPGTFLISGTWATTLTAQANQVMLSWINNASALRNSENQMIGGGMRDVWINDTSNRGQTGVQGVQIWGWDRFKSDHFQVDNLAGTPLILSGYTPVGSGGPVRESYFKDTELRDSGDPNSGQPTLEVMTDYGTAALGSDEINQISFDGLQVVFPYAEGVTVGSFNTAHVGQNGPRLLWFSNNFQIEGGSHSPGQALDANFDLVHILQGSDIGFSNGELANTGFGKSLIRADQFGYIYANGVSMRPAGLPALTYVGSVTNGSPTVTYVSGGNHTGFPQGNILQGAFIEAVDAGTCTSGAACGVYAANVSPVTGTGGSTLTLGSNYTGTTNAAATLSIYGGGYYFTSFQTGGLLSMLGGSWHDDPAQTLSGLATTANNILLPGGTLQKDIHDHNGIFTTDAGVSAFNAGFTAGNGAPTQVSSGGNILTTLTGEPLQLGFGAAAATTWMGFDNNRGFVGFNNTHNNLSLGAGGTRGVEITTNNNTFGSGEMALFDSAGNLCVGATDTNACTADPFIVSAAGAVTAGATTTTTLAASGAVTVPAITASGVVTGNANGAASTSSLLLTGVPAGATGGGSCTTSTCWPLMYLDVTGASEPTDRVGAGTMFGINQGVSETSDFAKFWKNGASSVWRVDQLGQTYTSKVINPPNGANGSELTLGTGGATIDNNTAGAFTPLTVNEISATGTGAIQKWQSQTVTQASMSTAGVLTATGLTVGAQVETFPASGAIVGTTDTQTLTNKSIAGSEVNSGTVAAANVGAINLAASGNGGVTGNLPVTNLASGTGATSTSYWRGDGAWGTPPGSGSPAASTAFTSQTSVTLTHNYGTLNVATFCRTATGTPIGYNSAISTDTNTVVITFSTAQTGTCFAESAVGPAGATGATGPSGSVLSVSGLSSLFTVAGGSSNAVFSFATGQTAHQVVSSGTSGTLALQALTAADVPVLPHGFTAAFNSGGSVLTTGAIAYMTVPAGFTISSWNINVDTGTASFDIWKVATGTANPTISNTIVGGSYPAITTGTAVHSTTIPGWTTTVAGNDLVAVQIKTVTGGATQATLQVTNQ
jgi:hypothetical protein